MKDVIVMMEQTSEEELRDLDKQLPSDIHLVEYTLDDEFQADGIRAHSMVDIFDFYYDLGAKVSRISSGFGQIKPQLFKNTENKDD